MPAGLPSKKLRPRLPQKSATLVEFRLRRYKPVAIEWTDLPTDTIAPSERRVIARVWASRARSEHSAVGAFSQLAYEAARLNAPSPILEMLTRAAHDEVRHATLCDDYAATLVGPEYQPLPRMGVPHGPTFGLEPSRERTLLRIVALSCFNETITSAYFTQMLKGPLHAPVRTLVSSLLEDEMDHARVGWAYAKVAIDAGWGESALTLAMDKLVASCMQPLVVARRFGRSHEAMRAFGYFAPGEDFAIAVDTLRSVVLPGFKTLGIDSKIGQDTLEALTRAS